jgi:hypothetical protein
MSANDVLGYLFALIFSVIIMSVGAVAGWPIQAAFLLGGGAGVIASIIGIVKSVL